MLAAYAVGLQIHTATRRVDPAVMGSQSSKRQDETGTLQQEGGIPEIAGAGHAGAFEITHNILHNLKR